MFFVYTILTLSFIGTIGARQPDIDINRIKLLSRASSRHIHQLNNPYARRSLESNQIGRSNDYDDHSSGFTQSRAPLHILYDASTHTEVKASKIHQPREDPRLFYQSDAYLKEINRKDVNNEVSSIYPGREVVRADEVVRKSLPLRKRFGESNNLNDVLGHDVCIRCPHDRTLIAKSGTDRVVLQYPRLLSCSGQKAPRDGRFIQMYGPKFGSLVGEGPHIVIGRLTYKSQTLQTCKIQINVLIQTCPVPKYLVPHCGQNKTCTFSCRDPKSEMHGKTTLTCGDDMKWKGSLPVCKARTWCEPPSPPVHGRVSCKGMTAGNGSNLSEGSSCHVRCARGWRRSSHAIAVCRRGVWTHTLTCHQKRSRSTH